jgi:tetratricopeptide (TPR) repeat protein
MNHRLEKYLSLCQQGETARQQGNLDEAISKFTDAYALMHKNDPVNYLALLQRALTHRLKSDFEAASRDFIILTKEFFDIKQHFYYGCVLSAVGDFSAAQSEFERVMELCLRRIMGCDYVVTSDAEIMQLALNDVGQFIEHDTRCAAGYFNRALLKRSMDDWTGALEDYRTALSLQPENRRLSEWVEAQNILKHDVPEKDNRAHLKANISCCYLSLDFIQETAEVQYFDAQNWEAKQLTFAEGDALVLELINDQWILLKEISLLSGSHSYFWRYKAQS